MSDISLRFQEAGDAERFFKILNNPNFVFFSAKPKTLKDEIEWLQKRVENRERNISYDYAIVLSDEIIGGIGIKIDQQRPYIAEIGYFIAEEYWGKGFAVSAISLAEKFAFEELGLHRLEIRMHVDNSASQRVAEKSGYLYEGVVHGAFRLADEFVDNHLFYKLNPAHSPGNQ
ncbi:GNAT family N-acetyltransferase [Candidatus Woesearchaeota archaeon]|nr:GNAT family N-acetyltransferase [Candidatus Woesearchaeota archaeon]